MDASDEFSRVGYDVVVLTVTLQGSAQSWVCPLCGLRSAVTDTLTDHFEVGVIFSLCICSAVFMTSDLFLKQEERPHGNQLIHIFIKS